MPTAAKLVRDGHPTARVLDASESLGRVVDNRLPLARQRLALFVELGEPLDLVGRDARLLRRGDERIVHLGELATARRDDQHGHLAHVLGRELDDARDLLLGVLVQLDAVVDNLV